jgi:hypothetical protein
MPQIRLDRPHEHRVVRAATLPIEECYRRAGLDLAQTAYVEAHMTGTATGDPIEAEKAVLITAASPLTGSVCPRFVLTDPTSTGSSELRRCRI